MRRYALRDDQWDRIKDLLPGREGWVGVTAKDNRLFVEGVLYRYRAGARPRGRRRAAAGLGRVRADRRQGVRRRGARAPTFGAGRQGRGDPAQGEPQGPAPVRPRLVQGAAPDRELLRQAEAVPGD